MYVLTAGASALRPFALLRVNIANRGEFCVRATERITHNFLPARAITNDAEAHLFVRPKHGMRQRQAANAGGDLSEELAAGTHRFCVYGTKTSLPP